MSEQLKCLNLNYDSNTKHTILITYRLQLINIGTLHNYYERSRLLKGGEGGGIYKGYPSSVRLYISMLLSVGLFFMLSISFRTRNLAATFYLISTEYSVGLGCESTKSSGKQSSFEMPSFYFKRLLLLMSISNMLFLV